jgi:hypothetical protein
VTNPVEAAAPKRSNPIRKHYRKHKRRHITFGDDELIPRAELAEEIGVSERTLQKLKLPVTSISNVSYVPRNAGLAAYVAAHTRHPPEPPKPRRRR